MPVTVKSFSPAKRFETADFAIYLLYVVNYAKIIKESDWSDH